jgi:RecA-family ATPase
VDDLIRQAIARGLHITYGARAVRVALTAGFEAADKGLGPGGGEAAWREHAITAPNLAAKTFAPVPFVLPGFIAKGITILAGKPRAGKSSLALDVSLAVAGGCRTLGGLQPAHGDVLYLALEESEQRLQRRVDRLLSSIRAPSAERLTLAGRWRHLEEGGIGDLADWCSSTAKPRLIVIDTLAKVQPPEKTRPYEIDRAAMARLRGLADARGVAVLRSITPRNGRRRTYSTAWG